MEEKRRFEEVFKIRLGQALMMELSELDLEVKTIRVTQLDKDKLGNITYRFDVNIDNKLVTTFNTIKMDDLELCDILELENFRNCVEEPNEIAWDLYEKRYPTNEPYSYLHLISNKYCECDIAKKIITILKEVQKEEILNIWYEHDENAFHITTIDFEEHVIPFAWKKADSDSYMNLQYEEGDEDFYLRYYYIPTYFMKAFFSVPRVLKEDCEYTEYCISSDEKEEIAKMFV